MTRIKLSLVLSCAVFFTALPGAAIQKGTRSSNLSFFRSNNCVLCHSRLTEPVRVSAHFYQWLNSTHEEYRVGCEKCHGGNPEAKDRDTAHIGVINHNSPESRLHYMKINSTCNDCHQQAVEAFTNSPHTQRLRGSDNQPNCTTCHQHMANSVVYWPPDTVKLCASCHNENGSASKSTDVPQKGGDIVAALTRTDEVIEWSYYLINEGKKRRLKLKTEQTELKRLEVLLKEAKLKYHAFNIKDSREMTDQVFTAATRIKNSLVDRGL